jgi:hypothetical protein
MSVLDRLKAIEVLRPITWGQAKLMGWPWPSTDEQLRELSAGMRAVAFRPTPTSAARGASRGKYNEESIVEAQSRFVVFRISPDACAESISQSRQRTR